MIVNGSYPELVVLDVRTKSEYDTGHIYGTLWIPVDELESRITELSAHVDNEIIVYCKSGGRSVTASEILDNHTFTKVYNMLGGITAWSSAEYPVWVSTVHNVDTGYNYDTIQAAINASQTLDGHTVFVDEGVYCEHVVVSKTLSLLGGDRDKTIVDGNGTGTVVHVARSNTTVTNLTISNGETGLKISTLGVYECCNVTVRGNVITRMAENGIGIWIFDVGNNTLADNTISECSIGMELSFSGSNIISRNIIANNTREGISSGLVIYVPSDASASLDLNVANLISENLLTDNGCGVNITNRSNEQLWHNNFVNNTVQAYVLRQYGFPAANTWDDGLEGNYWSDHNSTDANRDGIGDTEYAVATDNVDHYPLMGPFSSFATQMGHQVDVVSNSTIDHFEYSEVNGTIRLFVSNATSDQTFGFCRMRVPLALMNGTFQVEINSTEPLYANYSIFEDEQSRWIHISYEHSTLEIVIIPELSWLLLPALPPVTVLIALVARRKGTQADFAEKS
jgi:parallel beta-helix repeat protein